MEWIDHELKTRSVVLSEITKDCVVFEDMEDHVWVVRINNKGPSLFCYGIGKVDGRWHTKMIPEELGPDVFDCPRNFLEMTVSKNIEWRNTVERWNQSRTIQED